MTPEEQKRTLWVDQSCCPDNWVEILQKEKFICHSYYPLLGIGAIQIEGAHPRTIPDPLPRWLMRTQ